MCDRQVIISAIEHSSVLESAEFLMECGWRLDALSVDSNGVVRVDQLPRRISTRTALVSITAANHETGVVQPIGELAAICREAGVPIHTDAAQAVGKIPLSFRQLGVDALSLTAQKFRGPTGVGALIVRGDCPIRPILFGGKQQQGLRPGTEPLAFAAGLVTALELRIADLDRWTTKVQMLRDRFEQLLTAKLPDIVVHGRAASRIANTSNIAFPGCDASDLVHRLGASGIDCSTGSACESESDEPSPTLRAMQIDAALARASVRFSFGDELNESSIDEAAGRVVDIVGSYF